MVPTTSAVPAHQSSAYSYSVHQHSLPGQQQHHQQLQQQQLQPSKNVQAGPQLVGEGPGSHNARSGENPTAPPPPSSKHEDLSQGKAPKVLLASPVKDLPSKISSSRGPTVKASSKELFASKAEEKQQVQPSQEPAPIVVGQTTILPVATARRLECARPDPPASKLTVQPLPAPPSKSTLRDYRKPRPMPTTAPRPILPAKTSESAVVQCYPLAASQAGTGMSKTSKHLESAKMANSHPTKPTAANNNTSGHHPGLPQGLTITEVSRAKDGSRGRQTLPTFPASASALRRYDNSSVDRVHMFPARPMDSLPFRRSGATASRPIAQTAVSSTNSSTGHPGLPNGLLRMATAATMQGPQSGVLPKSSSSSTTTTTATANGRSNGHDFFAPSISASLAQSAANAVPQLKPPLKATRQGLKLKPSRGSRGSSPKRMGGRKTANGSPSSSRSSSRNSSLSPRDRQSPGSENGKNGSNGRPSSRSQLSPRLPSSGKKKALQPYPGPLLPWSQTHDSEPKGSNGWKWVGEGVEQKVFFNVSPRPKQLSSVIQSLPFRTRTLRCPASAIVPCGTPRATRSRCATAW